MPCSIMAFFWLSSPGLGPGSGLQAPHQGSGSGLKNLKPEPPQAEPEPGHSGRAGPATSLVANWSQPSKTFGFESLKLRFCEPENHSLLSWLVAQSLLLPFAVESFTGFDGRGQMQHDDDDDPSADQFVLSCLKEFHALVDVQSLTFNSLNRVTSSA
ncbi:hypothetical protein C8R45DRAFT_936084 [Mycena sanguinolenta]|nr:hypothetical protein C8R45DRAFT_936084 [Mycena sanguinolenta]